MPIFMGQNYKIFSNEILKKQPKEKASIKGSPKYPRIHGSVYFYPQKDGSLVVCELHGLPGLRANPSGVFAMHIHEGNRCSGDNTDPFKDAKSHYNPTNTLHPQHAGDLPSIFSNDGYAYQSFYTDRFKPEDVEGRTVILHLMPDDFRSQPSGNSGEKIACGVIKKY